MPEVHQGEWVASVQTAGERFAARAATYDADDSFVLENYAELKSMGAFAASIPSELGGGGASYHEIAEMLRSLARHCGSTALALSMHTHLVATQVWRWRRDPAAVENFLRRIVDEKLVLIRRRRTSDWLNGTGKAVRIDGGFRVTGRKIFGSGVPMGDYLMTGAVYRRSRVRGDGAALPARPEVGRRAHPRHLACDGPPRHRFARRRDRRCLRTGVGNCRASAAGPVAYADPRRGAGGLPPGLLGLSRDR